MPTPHTTAEQLPRELDHREAVVNGVRLHYVEAGRGPLVVLLHGFPCKTQGTPRVCPLASHK